MLSAISNSEEDHLEWWVFFHFIHFLPTCERKWLLIKDATKLLAVTFLFSHNKSIFFFHAGYKMINIVSFFSEQAQNSPSISICNLLFYFSLFQDWLSRVQGQNTCVKPGKYPVCDTCSCEAQIICPTGTRQVSFFCFCVKGNLQLLFQPQQLYLNQKGDKGGGYSLWELTKLLIIMI